MPGYARSACIAFRNSCDISCEKHPLPPIAMRALRMLPSSVTSNISASLDQSAVGALTVPMSEPARHRAAPSQPPSASTNWQGIELQVFADLGAIEAEWKEFERKADCTVFQSFGWLSKWQQHIGTLHRHVAGDRVRPRSRWPPALHHAVRHRKPRDRSAASPGSARNCATTTRRCSLPDFSQRLERRRASSNSGTRSSRCCAAGPISAST